MTQDCLIALFNNYKCVNRDCLGLNLMPVSFGITQCTENIVRRISTQNL